jgi:hypothetical protein
MAFMGIKLGLYNCLNCHGWATKATAMGPISFDIGSPCMMAKLGLVILFFITALVRKWGGEEIGVDFSFWWAIGLGMGLYLLAVTFTGSTQFAMLCGVIGMLIGGYLMGYILGGSESGE